MPVVTPTPSGLPTVDHQWGGLAAGRAYLLVGRAGAGRSALALQTARATIEDGRRCLLVSPRDPQELVEVGRTVGLDLAAAHNAGRLRLLRIPKAPDLAARGPEGLAKAYRDFAALVASDRPARVVVEDFTPLVQFDTFERFHDAFSGLVHALRAQETTLVIGLGAPANDASRRLLEVVEGLVDGTIHLGSGGDLVLSVPERPAYPSNDGSSVEATPPAPPPPAAPQPAAPPPPIAPPFTPDPTPMPPPAAAAPPVSAPPVAAPPVSAPPAAAPPVSAPPVAAPLPPAAAPPPMAAPPFAPPHAPPAPPTSAPAPPPAAPAPQAPPPSAPAPATAGSPPATEVVPPPAPDASLLAPPADAFGQDPADLLFAQGYLADSSGGGGLGAAPPPPMPTPGAPDAPPAFASLGAMGSAPAPDPGVAFRQALDEAFADRERGTPFVVIALRMEPGTAEAERFGAVEAGIRAGLRAPDRLLVDGPRKRAAVVLPASGQDAAQGLFGALQGHLRNTLGSEGDRVLGAIGAVTIPDGRPFQTADDLLAYAFQG